MVPSTLCQACELYDDVLHMVDNCERFSEPRRQWVEECGPDLTVRMRGDGDGVGHLARYLMSRRKQAGKDNE